MRIKIIGENDTAKALRALLRKAGFAVCEFLPAEAVTHSPEAGYAITIEEGGGSASLPAGQSGWIHLDSVDSELEAAVFRHITQLSPHPVSVDRPGGQVHSERELRVVVPAGDAAQTQAVEYGVLRGLLELIGPRPLHLPQPPGPANRGLWKRLVGVLGLWLLCGISLYAAPKRAAEIVLRATDDAGGVMTLRVPNGIFAQLQQPGSFGSVNVTQFGGTSISTGTGAGGAGIPRVTLSNDSSLAANQSVNLAQVAGTNTVTGGVNGTQGVGGTTAAGSAVAGNPFVMAGNASGNVTRAIFCDNWKVVSQTASAQIITGVAAKQTYICNAFLNSATAQSINIVEGTGSTCATGTAGMLGGTTASTGPNLAANQGFILPASAVPWMKTATAADNVCILQSGTGQVSGVIVYTQF
jgi:hypothetical protein